MNRRERLVQEIMKTVQKKCPDNYSRIVVFLTITTDKGLTKFHKEFMEKFGDVK